MAVPQSVPRGFGMSDCWWCGDAAAIWRAGGGSAPGMVDSFILAEDANSSPSFHHDKVEISLLS